jgi:hypothetical protein
MRPTLKMIIDILVKSGYTSPGIETYSVNTLRKLAKDELNRM